jgi:pimeloyl-ACP methyl ester carboxylesterase
VLLLGAAIGAAGMIRAFRRDMRAIRRSIEGRSRYARTRRGPVEYAREGKGRAALVIHGAGGGFDQGLSLGRELLGPGFDIVAPSRFGYLGMAVPDGHSPALQADVHAALLDALGIGEAVVIGVSAGAPSAIELALRHPGRIGALILVVPRAWSPHDRVAVDDSRPSRIVLAAVTAGVDLAFWVMMKLARASLVRFLGVPPDIESAAPAHERRRVDEIIRSILPLSARAAGIRADSEDAIGPWPLERLAAPTLVISAEDDLFNTLPGARHTAERVPGAELIALPSGGHLMVARVGEVRDAVADFVRRRVRATTGAYSEPLPDGKSRRVAGRSARAD